MKRLIPILVLAACAIPNVTQVRNDLKACADRCNAESDACFDAAQDGSEACLGYDAAYQAKEQCVAYYQRQGTQCLHNLVECIGICIGGQ